MISISCFLSINSFLSDKKPLWVYHNARKQTSRWVCFLTLGIDGLDFGHHFLDCIITEWWSVGVPREFYQVCRTIDACFVECFRACERTHDVVRLPAGRAPKVALAVVVTTDDAFDLPPLQFMQELLARKAYLAHEELIQFVSGSQFFACSSSSAVSSGFSSFGSISDSLKNSPTSCMTTA